ncbi:hypothetical protein HF086_005356 [Spodoptera exigua]|uniref:Carboxylesterase type B domain-containing protein n=1 Tax=Spodoptera exigua TaxID=7107 RepID=A0A922MR98_SPOEX|nr:hypothetical protein HF086_005356 [Spodoptera exigua]
MKSGKRIVLFTLFAINLVDQPAPEVKIEQGILSGKVSADGSYFEYIGIPYASTNSSTRFKAPLPPTSWNGVYRAVDEHYQCPQPSIFGVIGMEDCLKINVYVPVKAKKPFPVMVYIHGGTYIIGNGGKLLYGPDFLIHQDVILVTFNYRLGALGFICLGIKEAPGNAGLKDQIAALRWVRKNIAAFGGDPDNVTLFGLSAGATSVSMLIASNATKGLFKRAILQSGVSTSSWAVNRQPLFTASLVAKELGYDTEDPKTMYDIFSKIPYKDLIAAKPKKPIGKYFDFQLIHYPCVEKVIDGEEAVMTDLPYNLFNKNSKNISVIYGTTSKEGVILLPEETEDTLRERDSKYIFSPDLNFPSEDEAANLSSAVKEYYFGPRNISFKAQKALLDLNTHLYFEMPTLLESEIVMNKTNAPIYNYYFNYSGGRNFLKYISGYNDEPGACHGDEIMYLFKGNAWPFAISKKDQTMINWMTRLWTNFARYGNPTPPTNDLPVQWSPSTKGNMTFLYIEDELKMGPLPNPDPYRLWKNIYSKYRNTNIAPLPPPKWEGVYKAVDEMYQCPQHPIGLPIKAVGSEDCLKINVYVPAKTKGPLPVMVYIHGGAYVLGNGGKMVVGPEFLVKQDVILVSFNYRLGVLGFLCLHTQEAPGNAGLKDQVAALRWIKKNIAAFGGDPDNVTIFGTSAGASSVSFLVASETTNGLFQRAILHSGSSLANWAISYDPISVARNILKYWDTTQRTQRKCTKYFTDYQ